MVADRVTAKERDNAAQFLEQEVDKMRAETPTATYDHDRAEGP